MKKTCNNCRYYVSVSYFDIHLCIAETIEFKQAGENVKDSDVFILADSDDNSACISWEEITPLIRLVKRLSK